MQVRERTVNGNHFVGACAVGTVLDENLKVFGFDNLRVVDASAIPDMPPNAGPAASVYMLAEHVAERIVAEGPPRSASPGLPWNTNRFRFQLYNIIAEGHNPTKMIISGKPKSVFTAQVALKVARHVQHMCSH